MCDLPALPAPLCVSPSVVEVHSSHFDFGQNAMTAATTEGSEVAVFLLQLSFHVNVLEPQFLLEALLSATFSLQPSF
jgi:hypothetical protein